IYRLTPRVTRDMRKGQKKHTKGRESKNMMHRQPLRRRLRNMKNHPHRHQPVTQQRLQQTIIPRASARGMYMIVLMRWEYPSATAGAMHPTGTVQPSAQG